MMEIPNIDIIIDNDEVRSLTKDLYINSANLSEAYINQPALYAYYAAKYAKIKAVVDKAKLAVEAQKDYIEKTLKAKLDYQARKAIIAMNEKVTDSRINAYIGTSEEFQKEQAKLNELRERLVDAQAKLATLESAKESMHQRKDMLISLGAQIRAESGNTEFVLRNTAYQNINNKL